MQCLSHLLKNKAHFGATCDIKRKVCNSGGWMLHTHACMHERTHTPLTHVTYRNIPLSATPVLGSNNLGKKTEGD